MIVIVQRVKWIVKLSGSVKLNAPFCQIDCRFGKSIGVTETKRLFCETERLLLESACYDKVLENSRQANNLL